MHASAKSQKTRSEQTNPSHECLVADEPSSFEQKVKGHVAEFEAAFEDLQRARPRLNSVRTMKAIFTLGPVLGLLFGLATGAPAWDYEGHRLINQLALASLPKNFPGFVLSREDRERIAFLSGEADRWRNTSDLTLRHCNGPDHFFDLDLLKPHGLEVSRLSQFRYEFVAELAQARRTRSSEIPAIDPDKDLDRTRALIGFLPWAITEYQARLKSGFSYLKEYQNGGSPSEVVNAQQNIIYLMGVMGHFVGDGSQPLHTTKHHHGWRGENPSGYSTNYSIHSWIDGGYLGRFPVNFEEMLSRLRPARLLDAGTGGSSTNLLPAVLSYLARQHDRVDALYALEKAGKLSGQQLVPEGHAFMSEQLREGAQMLGDLWLTAWQQAPPDNFLRSALARRKLNSTNSAKRSFPD